MSDSQIICGDALETLKILSDQSVHCCVTSPPYWGLRDYGVKEQLGLEKSPEEYVERVTEIFREVRRVLRDDGTLWLNLGDSYIASATGKGGENACMLEGGRKTQPEAQKRPDKKSCSLKPKNLVGIPWRVAFALQADGWYLRSDIIWHKPNPMPESVTDRPTKSHEYIFLLSKSKKYYYDADAIAEPAVKAGQVLHKYGSGAKDRQDVSDANDRRTRIGIANWDQPCPNTRNKRTVWSITTKPYPEAHFATFPEELIIPCIKAGCPEGGIVLDPFGGACTTALVAVKLGRQYIIIEIKLEYCEMGKKRLKDKMGLFL